MRARLGMGASRPWMTVSLRLPVDFVEELKEVAPLLGWSRWETLMRIYMADGLRRDVERLDGSLAADLAESLRKRGVAEEAIAAAIEEAGLKKA